MKEKIVFLFLMVMICQCLLIPEKASAIPRRLYDRNKEQPPRPPKAKKVENQDRQLEEKKVNADS